jgi:hypothetical protein
VGKPIGLCAQFFVGTTGRGLLGFALTFAFSLRNFDSLDYRGGGKGFIVIWTAFSNYILECSLS